MPKLRLNKHTRPRIGVASRLGKTVLDELSRRDAGGRRRLAGLKTVYPRHEEFVAKVGGLDACGLPKVLKRLSFLAQTKVYLFWRKDEAV
jgi:hypothetical protein